MDENIAALVNLIDARGYIPQLALGTNIIEIHRKQSCQLFGKVKYGTDATVQKLGKVARKKINILDKHTVKGQMDDQG